MHHPTNKIAHTTAFVTPVVEQAWTRNSLMGPPWRIDPTTHRTMSEHSYHRATSRYWACDISSPYFIPCYNHWPCLCIPPGVRASPTWGRDWCTEASVRPVSRRSWSSSRSSSRYQWWTLGLNVVGGQIPPVAETCHRMEGTVLFNDVLNTFYFSNTILMTRLIK